MFDVSRLRLVVRRVVGSVAVGVVSFVVNLVTASFGAEKPARPSVPGGAFRARLFVFRLRDVGSRSTRLLADRSGCSVVDLYLRGVPVAVSNEPGTSRLEVELGQLHLSLDAIGHGRASSRTVIAHSTADGLRDTRLAILR